MKRTKLVYLLGRNEKELLADDEYDSEGGEWFTDNPIMAREYAHELLLFATAEKKGLDVYMWEATYDTDKNKIIKEDIWVQFTKEEAIEEIKRCWA
jgi:hypothetical protein